ncbi:MAG: class I SAM-dependent methyltransferase, partial [Thermoguttaceae bacterium]|nr:class I SAM-dependent methyltransferase [Thermoguttaceae bacterium]
IEAACQKYASGTVRTLLEPACGTGRLVVELARRGYQVFGLDTNLAALGYLRRRLRRRGLPSLAFAADMSRFALAAPVDAAYCTFDSFRHLLTEHAARQHLQCMAQAVRPGGIYILGFHLLPPDASDQCIERWTEQRGRTEVTVTLRVLRCNRRQRIEWIRIALLVRKQLERKVPANTGNLLKNHRPTTETRSIQKKRFRLPKPTQWQQSTPSHLQTIQVLRFRDEFPLRIYTARQFRRLLATVPQWQLADVYDFWYEIDRPMKLTDQMADCVFILRRRAEE